MKFNRLFSFIFIIILSVPINLEAQSKIITDNSIYTSFDLIHYSFFTGINQAQFYALELIGSEGRSWIQQKIKSDSGFFYGVLHLNIHMPTGIYWLHAYPSVFSLQTGPQYYLPLIIFNANDLEAGRWRKYFFNTDSISILPVQPPSDVREIPGSRIYAAIDPNYHIISISEKLEYNSGKIITPVISKKSGMIVLSNQVDPIPGHNLSFIAKPGDTLSINLLKNNDAINQNAFIENLRQEEPVLSPFKISISSDKTSYNVDDSVILIINTSDNPSSLNARLTVEAQELQSSAINFENANTYLLKKSSTNVNANDKLNEDINRSSKYLINGTFIDPSNGHPMAYHTVAMMCLGKKPVFQVASVDPTSKFSFDVSSLPENNSVFISTIEEPINGLSIRDSYFRKFSDFPVLYFDPTIIAGLDSFISIAKIRDVVYYQYLEKKVGKPVISEELLYDSTQVYNHADISYDLNEYIHFDNIPEVIREILPYVNFKNSNENPKITIYNSTNPDLNRYPLFLVNGLPTYNVGIILNLSTRDVQKIDLLYEINTIHSFGLIGLGGIMAIYTAKPPEIPNSELLEFTGLHQPSPVYVTQGRKNAPDLSPVIYWNAAAYFKEGNCLVKFKLNDLLSDILINVTGYDKDGKIIKSSTILKVNKNIKD